MRRAALALGLGLLLSGGAHPAWAQFDNNATNYKTALEFFKLGEWVTAERILVEILGHSPDHHQARWTLASLYLRTGRQDQASKLFAEIANREGGELAKHAKAWLEKNQAAAGPKASFTADASGSVTLSPLTTGFQKADFPTAPLSLEIPSTFKLQSTQVQRLGDVIQAKYLFAPDAKAAQRLGIWVEVTTLPRGEDPANHRVAMVREMLSRDGLDKNNPFREKDQLIHGHLARYLGYSDPTVARVQVLALGVATDRYRVIMRAACHETVSKQHLGKLQATLGSLQLR